MFEEGLQEELRAFVSERDWAQFHSPENLAKSISIESAELLEQFQWGEPSNLDGAIEELADVLTYCLLLADRIGVEPSTIIREKLQVTKAKYPVDKAKGRSDKYNQL